MEAFGLSRRIDSMEHDSFFSIGKECSFRNFLGGLIPSATYFVVDDGNKEKHPVQSSNYPQFHRFELLGCNVLVITIF